MYLTRLTLDPRSQAIQNWLSNPYRIHQRLWRGVPEIIQRQHEALTSATPPFLYKVEIKPQLGMLVQSLHKIDWGSVFADEKILKPLTEDTKILTPEKFIVAGRSYRFSLLANATKKVKDYRSVFAAELSGYPVTSGRVDRADYKEGKVRLEELKKTLSKEQKERIKSKKVGVYSEMEQLAWLARRGMAGGFQLQSAIVESTQTISATKKKMEGGGGEIRKILAVTFAGLLEVTDSETFIKTYAAGIGSAKAFGCGLLLLAPARA
ncbi:MAG TPA: type I-E CRISPR-associated protein Cas6/Cse3/CasE [Turneriella sp.]|nr:type I-E CRISPR-associated protein Cas6/Cse3/CasE [Turneriella sp.]